MKGITKARKPTGEKELGTGTLHRKPALQGRGATALPVTLKKFFTYIYGAPAAKVARALSIVRGLPQKNKLPIDSAAYPISFVQLFSLGCSYGAGICASAAVDALGSVDSVNVTGRDSLYGAAVCASAASDALISIDLISHWSCSSLYVIGKPGTLSGHTAPTVLYHIPQKKSIDFTGIMQFATANFCGSYGVSDTFSFMLPAYSPFRPEKDAANMHDRILLFKCFGELDTKPHFIFRNRLKSQSI